MSEEETQTNLCRAWCFTLNNYTEDDWEKCDKIENCIYGVIGKEVSASGTKHLQGFYYFKTEKSLKQMKEIFQKAHWKNKYKNSLFVNTSNYCKKGEQPHAEWEIAKENGVNWGKNAVYKEFGILPMDQKRKGEFGDKTIKERWNLAKEGKFEELPPEQIKIYEYIFRKHSSISDRNELNNLWIYGQSGIGKSKYVNDNYPDAYKKMMNKWWDGYNHEETVVLEDFDPSHSQYLSYYLKIWADHYKFNAEVKGGSLTIRPKIFIITSQYLPDQCFHEDKTLEAIGRRFKIINLHELYNIHDYHLSN